MPRLIATNLSKEEFIRMKISPVNVKGNTVRVTTKQSWEDRSNWTNVLNLGYLTPLLKKGTNGNLTMDDIGCVQAGEEADVCFRQFEKIWEEEVSSSFLEKRPPSVMRAQLKMIGFQKLVIALFFYLLYAILQFFPVAILNILVQHFSGTGFDTIRSPILVLMVFGLLIIPIVGSVFQTRHDVLMAKYGLRSAENLITIYVNVYLLLLSLLHTHTLF